ncbi:MAG: glycosyltransferase [Methylotenera sp.]|nr:glycosyltransferase [Methylotenera sp.]
MVNQPPLITIIVAVFNGAETLQQCIDSVSQQTYTNIELIIIDGGSKDGTTDLLITNNKKISYWVSEPDNGIYNAWNKGLAQASGEWIYFLGADDFLWNINVLEQLANQLVLIPQDIHVVYGQIMLLTPEGKSLCVKGKPWQKAKKSLKYKMTIPNQGVMHRRSLFDLHGNFDETFRITGDYELLLRELKTGDAIFIPEIIVAGMRVGGISSNKENALVLLSEWRRAQIIHGQKRLSLGWIKTYIKFYIRSFL